MEQVGKILLITKKEYEEYEKKAKIVNSQRDSQKLNMSLRMPYYIPTINDFESNPDISITDLLPYYVYLMTKTEDGKYLIEPDNPVLQETREYLIKEISPRILIVENKNALNNLLDKIE